MAATFDGKTVLFTDGSPGTGHGPGVRHVGLAVTDVPAGSGAQPTR